MTEERESIRFFEERLFFAMFAMFFLDCFSHILEVLCHVSVVCVIWERNWKWLWCVELCQWFFNFWRRRKDDLYLIWNFFWDLHRFSERVIWEKRFYLLDDVNREILLPIFWDDQLCPRNDLNMYVLHSQLLESNLEGLLKFKFPFNFIQSY